MGTPDFALFSLRALVESGENVIGVVTQTDKPKGRGYNLLPPPVKVYAASHGIPVYQPKTLRTEEFAALLSQIAPDLIVVVAFGKILPENVLSFPRFGCINVHGSLLPAYRGAAPMQRVVDDLKEYLKLPDNIRPFAIVTMGYPAETPKQPEGRFKEEKIHWGKY